MGFRGRRRASSVPTIPNGTTNPMDRFEKDTECARTASGIAAANKTTVATPSTRAVRAVARERTAAASRPRLEFT
jgi:hypothetical protein